MPKYARGVTSRREADLNRRLTRAFGQWEAGELTSAFRSFLAVAKAGDLGAQIMIGNFYSEGIGVTSDHAKALYWYRRAYRRGYGPAANNIGVLFRDEKRPRQAIAWFERAVMLGDGDANLEIAKVYLTQNEQAKAAQYLKQALKAKPDDITEGSREEAQQLLKELKAR